MPTVLEKQIGPVRVITLNRPAVRNALNGDVFHELYGALGRASEDSGVRCLVITGAGRGFSSGADYQDPFFGTDEGAGARRAERLRLVYAMVQRLRDAPFTTIAAVNGACAGSGLSIAALCDIRLLADDARFHLSFARAAVFPDVSASVMLPRLVGAGRAMELYLLDEPVDADRAVQLGLATRAVPAAELMDSAVQLATTLAARSQVAVVQARKAMTELPSLPFDEAIAEEAELLLAHLFSPDVAEAANAFLTGRDPDFSAPQGHA